MKLVRESLNFSDDSDPIEDMLGKDESEYYYLTDGRVIRMRENFVEGMAGETMIWRIFMDIDSEETLRFNEFKDFLKEDDLIEISEILADDADCNQSNAISWTR